MSGEEEAKLSAKKRKRSWRQAVRRAAKKAKISELEAVPSKENKRTLQELKEKMKIKKQERKEKKNAEKIEKPKSKTEELVDKLAASRFRYLNEQLYTMDSFDGKKLFQDDETAFEAYHKGYRSQVNVWLIFQLLLYYLG